VYGHQPAERLYLLTDAANPGFQSSVDLVLLSVRAMRVVRGFGTVVWPTTGGQVLSAG
jgi:hypothetical protein